MRVFNFFARYISYTFAIALFTVFISLFLYAFGVFLGSSFILYSSQKIDIYIRYHFPVAIIISGFFHLVLYGFLTPIKIQAGLKSFRRLNISFKNNFNEAHSDLQRTYGYLSDLPMNNMLVSVITTGLSGIIIVAIAMYRFRFEKSINLDELRIIFKIVTLSIITIMVLYGIASYLITENLTNTERAKVYNLLLKGGRDISPRVLIGVRVKFLFFIILTIITLLTFAALMEKARYFDNYNLTEVIIYFALSIIASLALMMVTTNSIVKILSDVRRVAKEIAGGGKAAFEILPLEREFASIEYGLMEMAWEIEDHRKNLENAVQQRTQDLQDALVNLEGRDNQIQKQLDMASVIQRSILPSQLDDWNELKFAVRYIAMEKIGGDFYDLHQLKGDKIGVMVADVSGHGIPAALVTTMAKITFGNAGSQNSSPRRIFQEVNQNILDHMKSQDYMTCFMVAIDDEYNVVYSNASHQKAILLRTNQGEIEELDTNGLFIGAIEEARDSYEELSTKLNYGDRLILYTDGIPEAVNEERKDYGNKRLESIIIQNKDMALEEFSSSIIEDLQRFVGNSQPEDDITLLVIELSRDEAIEIIRNSKKMIDSHKYFEAIEMLEEGLSQFPRNQKLLYNLTKNYFRVNNYNKALTMIDQYLKGDKRNKFAYYLAGASCYQMLDYPAAIDHLEKALQIDSNFDKALFALAMSQKKQGEFEAAISSFEKLISIDSSNKMALFELKKLREEE